MDNLRHNQKEAQKNAALPNSKNIKLLIIEDSSFLQLAITEMLNALGYSADFASDAKEALNLYKNDYHLILMDIEVPILNGLEITQIIRSIEKNNKMKNVPIIAMTSHHDEPEYQEKCLEVGMYEVHGKPSCNLLKELICKYA